MGRPPCCDCENEKVGIKKGPWMPEEDIILSSYIQEHGPRNWRSVSVNTGLMRSSQSCRLRWTNYLRPGVRRGNFTPHEEDIIVQLQSLLGNRWAAIATCLPHRTDGDIKNYWYTHLKHKLIKQQAIGASSLPPPPSEPSITPTMIASHVDRHHDITTNPLSKDSYARPVAEVNTNGYYSSSSYASSMDNISKLLNGFMKRSPTQGDATNIKPSSVIDSNPSFHFDHKSGGALPPAISDVSPLMPPPPQLSSIEDWLFDNATEQVVHQLMEISDGCCSVPMLL